MRYTAEHCPGDGFHCDQGCGPWPCAIARQDLRDLARSFPRTIRLHLEAQADRAHQTGIPGDLTDRFTGWLPQAVS